MRPCKNISESSEWSITRPLQAGMLSSCEEDVGPDPLMHISCVLLVTLSLKREILNLINELQNTDSH